MLRSARTRIPPFAVGVVVETLEQRRNAVKYFRLAGDGLPSYFVRVRSAAPLEAEEYAGVDSCTMPDSTRYVVKVFLTVLPVYSLPPSVCRRVICVVEMCQGRASWRDCSSACRIGGGSQSHEEQRESLPHETH